MLHLSHGLYQEQQAIDAIVLRLFEGCKVRGFRNALVIGPQMQYPINPDVGRRDLLAKTLIMRSHARIDAVVIDTQGGEIRPDLDAHTPFAGCF